MIHHEREYFSVIWTHIPKWSTCPNNQNINRKHDSVSKLIKNLQPKHLAPFVGIFLSKKPKVMENRKEGEEVQSWEDRLSVME